MGSDPTRAQDDWVRPVGLTPLLAALALVLVAGCGGDEEAGADLPLGRQIAATASFDQGVHIFAEPVRASVEIVVDRERIDPARLELQTRFLPYDVVEQSETQESRGRFEVRRYGYVLRCLRIACIPEILQSAAGEAETGRGERQTIALPPARVLYHDPEGDERVVARARWPALVSVSRIREGDVPSFGYVFKTSAAPLPAPDYRLPPPVLGAGLFGGALALLALPAAFAIGWIRRRRPRAPALEPEVELTPLERALRLVEWARAREDGTERREALEVLATELDFLERPELADSARTLAWSPSSPTPEDAGELVRAVREPESESDA
ncbi:MAG TPA: hypothetical protein VMN35_04660 [Gaiellaceae bacterium]|nr:hypothetical protein [Gaiellaceae bacterium]